MKYRVIFSRRLFSVVGAFLLLSGAGSPADAQQLSITQGNGNSHPKLTISELSDISESDWIWLDLQSPRGREHFDPKKCSVGAKEYVYWAVGEKVFEIPYLDSKKFPLYPPTIDGTGSQRQIPPAPDPAEPAGCYLNPYRGGEMPYAKNMIISHFHRVWRRNLGGKWPFSTGVNIIATSSDPSNRSSRQKSRREPGNIWLKIRDADLSRQQDCTSRPSGITHCWIPSSLSQNSRLKLMDALVHIDKKLLVSAPGFDEDLTFYVWDYPGNEGRIGGVVGVDVFIYEDIFFRGGLGMRSIEEMDRVVEFVNGVTNSVLHHRVKKYDWKVR